MLSLSQTAGYGILALSCLEEDRWILAQELAERTGAPKPYLSKILHDLAKAQLVLAKRGYRGGFRLARSPDQIRLLDIAEAVDGVAWVSRCLLGLDTCSDERACPTHEFWKQERGRIHACLARISLKDVAEFERQRTVRVQPQADEQSGWANRHARGD